MAQDLSRRAAGSQLTVDDPEQSQQDSTIQRVPGTISGTVVDPTGAVVPGVRVRLTHGTAVHQEASRPDAVTDEHGRFTFAGIAPGAFDLTITAAGFAQQTLSGVLQSGETQELPPILLDIAEARTTVQAVLPQVEVAQEQVRIEEKQRVLGIVPDFYVSYFPNAAPLTAGQKFKLAWKSAADPFTFVLAGSIAGIQQAQNRFGAYGQEAAGYSRRYGAAYADTVSATFLADAALASLFKQDPRYFYKGTGGKRSRALYAIANSVICKGDNGRWQPNYSRLLGHLGAAGISNLYYPAQDRNGAGLTLENGAIGIGGNAIANLLQEFVVRRFTPKVWKPDPEKP